MKRVILIISIFFTLFSASAFSAPQITDSGAPETALTEAEKRAFEEYSEVRMFLKGNRYPYAYYEGGEYKGIYPDYLKNISELSGIKFTLVPYESDEQLEQFFTIGKADALAVTYGDVTGLYKTTEPFTAVEYNVVAPKDSKLNENNNHTVAVSNTDIMIRHYIEENYPNWTIIPCRDIETALKTVNNGKADMTFLTALDLQLNYSLMTYKNLNVSGDISFFVPVSIAVSTVSNFYAESLVSLLNKYIVFEPIRSNDEIRRKYILNHIYMPSIREFFFVHNEIIMLVLFMILAGIAAVIMRMRYMRIKMEKDSLTGLWNKRKFIKEAEKTLRNSKNAPYLLAVLDVERFKIINDRFGIHVGNQTLKTMANNIASIFRGSGIYGRSTSDEFVILTLDSPPHRALLEEAANMDITINNATYYKVPIKVGVCPVRYSDTVNLDISNFIDRAKIVNAKIKGHQDQSITYFTKQMGDKIARENELETIMRKSLGNNEFLVYYQPKYDLANNNIIGAEALVRWKHPDKGLISPGDFIPLFEKNGFIVELDFYVYEQVMKMQQRRMKQNKKLVPVSMNVSRCHLNSTTFTHHLEELAGKYNVPKDIIEMEITESIFSEEDRAAVALMDELKEHGFMLSMDDFGSGYSSLNLLRELPIDILKIDKGFLDEMDGSDKSKVIVEEIISMATRINIRTVCEGVETEQQRDFLKQAGCNIAQGFFYARPMPQNEFEDLLDKN